MFSDVQKSNRRDCVKELHDLSGLVANIIEHAFCDVALDGVLFGLLRRFFRTMPSVHGKAFIWQAFEKMRKRSEARLDCRIAIGKAQSPIVRGFS